MGRVGVALYGSRPRSLSGCASVPGEVRPWSTAAAPSGGRLGLAIVRELSEAMGGRVSVENLPSQGACFTICLPD